MINSTTNEEESESRPFNREIYNYLRKVQTKKSKEMLMNDSGYVFVAQCKSKYLSEPKPRDVKIFTEHIREILRKSNVNKTRNHLELTSVYEVQNEDLNQSILVDCSVKDANSKKFAKSNTPNISPEPSWHSVYSECDTMKTIYHKSTKNEKPNAVLLNILGPFPDEPLLAAFETCICWMIPTLE